MGQVEVFQGHIADVPGVGLVVLVILGFCYHRFRENVLPVKEGFQGALYIGQCPFSLMERRQDGNEHIGVVLDLVQVKVVLVIAVGCGVIVQVVLQLRLHTGVGRLRRQNILILCGVSGGTDGSTRTAAQGSQRRGAGLKQDDNQQADKYE